MRTRWLTFLAVLIAAAVGVGPLRADYEFQFANSSGTLQNSFTISSLGGTVAIEVYLTQFNGQTGLSTSGLTAAGVGLSNSPTGVAQVKSTGDIVANSQFTNTTNITTSASQSTLNEYQSGGASPVVPPTGNPNSILIGTFTYTGVGLGTTLVETTPYAEASPYENNVLADGTVLDSMIQNASAVITVVPEPGSFVLGGFAAATIGLGAWRRWRVPKQDVV